MKKLSFLTITAFMTFSLGAKAQILEVDSKAAFQADTPSATDITFETIAPADFTAPPGSTTIDGTSFNPTGSYYIVAANSATFVGNGYSSGDGSTYVYLSAPLSIAPAAGANAVGFDSFADGDTAETVTGTVTDSLHHTLTYSFAAAGATGSPSLTFLGFVDTYAGATITSITVSSSSFDNVLVGTGAISAPSVPEPATWAMMLGGLGALIFFRRIRNKA